MLNFKTGLFDKTKNEDIRINHDEQDATNKIAKGLFAYDPFHKH